ncbi:hypothetical protein TIFTF001_004207 [Ficus carica]|uniref:Uncharacterized protein n=1 Tax=Ficus carica TaxID=3494 RepID=A0AA87ZGZ7_FICCA|nr:hypothetical protein TIFTF001_004207 [Ficus carica]
MTTASSELKSLVAGWPIQRLRISASPMLCRRVVGRSRGHRNGERGRERMVVTFSGVIGEEREK